MSQVKNNSIQTGYGSQTAGGASRATEVNDTGRNGASKNNGFKDPFAAISPANQTKFDFQKVTAHGQELATKARERRERMPDYSQRNEDGSLISWKDLDKEYMPDQQTAANRNNELEAKAFGDITPEASLTAFQTKEEDKEKTATKPAQETLVASHDFDKQQAKSTGATGTSDKAQA